MEILIASAVDDVSEMYRSTWGKVIALMATHNKEQRFILWADQSKLRTSIATELGLFKTASEARINLALDTMTEASAKVAKSDLGAFMSGELKSGKHQFVDILRNDMKLGIAVTTSRMSDESKRVMKEATVKVYRLSGVDGISRQRAFEKLQNEILMAQPNFTFADRAGRKWANKTYLEMLTRTVSNSASREAYAETLIANGHDLVVVSSHGAIDKCIGWEGKILSLTGATPGITTYYEAMASGDVFHPNCLHVITAYNPSAMAPILSA